MRDWFQLEDWFGYLQNTHKLGEVSNLLPVADKLGLEESDKKWLIDTMWQSDRKQLEEILQRCKNFDPGESHSELKTQLNDVDSCDVKVSNRGQMHVRNLRKLKILCEELGRDPDEEKKRYVIARARKLIFSVLRDSCIEIAEDEREIEICLASEQFTECLNALPRLKEKIDNLLNDGAQYEVLEYVVPKVVQFVKEIYKCDEEEEPSLNGMHGLSADFLNESRRNLGELVIKHKGPRILSEISKILEKLCITNEQNLQCRHKSVTLDDFKSWSRGMLINEFLKALSHFFQEVKGMKIKKRIELKAGMMQEIVDEGEECQFTARDLGNIAQELLCFVQFVSARLVQFEVCRCKPEEMLEVKANGSVSGGTNGAIYCQNFLVVRKGTPQIQVRATARINIDGEESKTPCLQLVECAFKKKHSSSSKQCKGEETELKLMYNHSQRRVTCESPNFEEQVAADVEDERTPELCCSSPTVLSLPGAAGGCHDLEQVPPQEIIPLLSSLCLAQGEEIPSGDIQSQDINKKFQLFLKWLSTEPIENIVDKMLNHLDITSPCSQLTDIPENTKENIRIFLQCIIQPDVQEKKREELFKGLRKKLPFGCTGPFLSEDSLVRDIPLERRRKLCRDLVGYGKWEDLAARVNLTHLDMNYIRKTKDDPAEYVLEKWETKGLKVRDLYDALVQIGCEALADLL